MAKRKIKRRLLFLKGRTEDSSMSGDDENTNATEAMRYSSKENH